MTRKEQIEQESAINAAYIGGLEIAGDFSEEKLQTYQNGFINGAEWADNNPKNPWIIVEDDLPFNHKELLDSSKRMTFQVFIRYDDGRYGFSCMAKILDEWKWLNNWNKITHWMKVPEIPKEE